ncbi:MAG: hypothetical protein AB1763_04765 [Campylobacterota bacterium]
MLLYWRELIILGLTIAVVVAGAYVLKTTGERNFFEQAVSTKEAELSGSKREIEYLKAWMARDKLDAQAKDAEYNRTMAAKPKYVTQIKYVPTGEKCADFQGIISEARLNQEATR